MENNDIITEIKSWSSYLEDGDSQIDELAEVVQNLINDGIPSDVALGTVGRVFNITAGMFGA